MTVALSRFKTFASVLPAIAILSVVASSSVSARSARLEVIAGNEPLAGTRAASVDMNADGRSELLLHGHKSILVYAHDEWLSRGCTGQINFLDSTSEPGNHAILDVTAGGLLDVVVPLWDGRGSFVRAYSPTGAVLWSSEPIPDFNKEPEKVLPAITVYDILKTGGRRLLLCRTNTGFRRTPRSILTFNIETGRVAWSVPFASIPHLAASGDVLGRDGIPEVLVGTHAPNNGVAVRGGTDSTSVVCLLDARGDIIWEHTVGGKFSRAETRLEDANGDGMPEIFVLYHPNPSSERRSELQIRDPATGRVEAHRSFPDQEITDWAFSDLDSDGRKEALLTLSSGGLASLDCNLEMRRIVPISSSSLNYVYATDLEGDGSSEVICTSASAMFVLNRRLELIADGECQGAVLLRGEGAGRHGIWLAPQDGVISQVRIVPRAGLPGVVYAAGAVILALMAWGFLHVRGRLRQGRTSQREALWERLLLEMREFWHGEASRNSLAALERAIRQEMTHRGSSKSRPREGSFQEAAREVLHVSADNAIETMRLASLLGIGASTHNRALEDPKAAVVRIRVLTEAALSDRALRDSLEAVRGIQAGISEITSSLRSHFSADVTDEIKQALAKVFEWKGNGDTAPDSDRSAKTKPEIRLDVAGRPRVFARPGDLRMVVTHLLENAKAAMEGAREPMIEIRVRSDPMHTLIVVRDNGCGIASNRWDSVFRDGITTKTGDHGHGLALCRERLAQYHATLKVAESDEGLGTAFEVRLETTPEGSGS